MTRFGGLGSMLLLLHDAGLWLKPKWHAAVSCKEPEAATLFRSSGAESSLRVAGHGYS